ncbi:MAG: hypothetical protein J2P30_13385, partial [Actinobacteria bacterium]|nr:hypothetical protein [Actinomycetota bacterium]
MLVSQASCDEVIHGQALQVEEMSLTPDAGTLIIGGTFLQVNGLSIPRVALLADGVEGVSRRGR